MTTRGFHRSMAVAGLVTALGIVAGALVFFDPVPAGAQEQSKDTVVLRAVNDKQPKTAGVAPLDRFVFRQLPREKGERAGVELTFEMDLESTADQPLDSAVEALRQLVKLQTLVELEASDKRAPMVTVAWTGGSPTFQGVIAVLSVRYTLFFNDGTPGRATATINMRSAADAKSKGKDC